MAVPRRRGLKPCPSDYLAPNQKWPDGSLVADAPDVARFVQTLVRRLNSACGGNERPSIYAVAKKADVNPQTVFNLLHGKTWGDVPIIYRLEAAIGQELWTHDHLPGRWDRSNLQQHRP